MTEENRDVSQEAEEIVEPAEGEIIEVQQDTLAGRYGEHNVLILGEPKTMGTFFLRVGERGDEEDIEEDLEGTRIPHLDYLRHELEHAERALRALPSLDNGRINQENKAIGDILSEIEKGHEEYSNDVLDQLSEKRRRQIART